MYRISVVSQVFFLVSVCLFFIFLTNSCKEKKQNKIVHEPALQLHDSIRKKPAGSFSDTLVISYPTAVFFNPDNLQIQKIKELSDENEFESSKHDCFYQMKNARNVMKHYWPKIKIIETTTHRVLQFVKSNKTTVNIDLNNTADMCGIFLFDGKKEPELTDMMNIDTFLGFYFEK